MENGKRKKISKFTEKTENGIPSNPEWGGVIESNNSPPALPPFTQASSLLDDGPHRYYTHTSLLFYSRRINIYLYSRF
jgi:hypothetical protein